MKVVVQRSKNSDVYIDNKLYNKIDSGLVVFSCFNELDNEEDIDYIVKKIVNLRIFDDENGVMNKSILDAKGSILSISQFTLYADTSKGNRPSYNKALKGDQAILLYDKFNEKLKEWTNVVTGKFGAEMEVHITNDGPVTIIIDSQSR